MYQEFYGFREMPFNITPNPRFLFLSPTHQEALQHLRYGIEQKKGFIVLTGEVGCGKTTLCRKLLSELDADSIDTALVVNPRLSETQLLKAIMTELGEETKARSKNDLVNAISSVLLERISAGREIVLIIDEAQNLSFEVMEQLRLLSNLETDDQKLLQIILMGQPELKTKLQEERLRQLRQRVLVYYDLLPLNREQANQYIQHRLALAGGMGRPTFTPRSLKSLHKASQGIPRLINSLADKALLSAFIRRADTVTWWDVRRAVKDLKRLGAQ
ncbi:MAG: ExeA family protein [Opitutales bacterium]